MDRKELAALRDALSAILTWPEPVLEQIAAWLAPETAKPNGRDPHPPSSALGAPIEAFLAPVGAKTRKASETAEVSPRRSPTPHAGKTRPGAPPASAKAAEQRLLAAMQEHSGASVNVLAKTAGANRSSTGERLRQLARDGVVSKDSAGHWRLVAELAGEQPRPPMQPPAS